MKKIFAFAFLLALGFSGFAQNSKLIIGKWAFVSLQDDGKTDEETKQITNMMFKDMIMNFREDNTMSLQLKKKAEPATYSFDKSDDKIINGVTQGGKPMTLAIVKLTKEELILNMDKGGIFSFKKVSDTPDAAQQNPPAVKMPITAKQLTGKWDLVDMEKEKKSALFNDLIKGAFLEFNADATYHSKILDIEEEGEWMMMKNNTVIEIETADGKSYWNVLKASDTEMTLERGDGGAKFMFKKAQ